MPRPNPNRSIGAESRMRERIVALLAEQDRSTAWLGRKAGLPDTAMWRILNAGRAIYVDEAVAISDALGVPLSDLARP